MFDAFETDGQSVGPDAGGAEVVRDVVGGAGEVQGVGPAGPVEPHVQLDAGLQQGLVEVEGVRVGAAVHPQPQRVGGVRVGDEGDLAVGADDHAAVLRGDVEAVRGPVAGGGPGADTDVPAAAAVVAELGEVAVEEVLAGVAGVGGGLAGVLLRHDRHDGGGVEHPPRFQPPHRQPHRAGGGGTGEVRDGGPVFEARGAAALAVIGGGAGDGAAGQATEQRHDGRRDGDAARAGGNRRGEPAGGRRRGPAAGAGGGSGMRGGGRGETRPAGGKYREGPAGASNFVRQVKAGFPNPAAPTGPEADRTVPHLGNGSR